VTLETAREIAESGVDFVSVGGITHSAPSLDFSLLLEPA
jgi:nicotinate-nucleotide pyrophosphorylase (carboxylating)